MQHAEGTTEQVPESFWQRYKWLLIAAVGMTAGLLLGWGVLTIVDASYVYHGTVIQSPDPAGNFTLIGPGGEALSLEDFRGQAVMIYFGYTFCPDVCPATMAELAAARRMLGRQAGDVQVLMITVDPARDNSEKLQQYVTHFDSSFIGLTGSEDQIAQAATPFGIYYEKHEGSEASGYLIDHTASVIVIDQDGHLRLIYPFGTSGEEMAEDMRHLLN